VHDGVTADPSRTPEARRADAGLCVALLLCGVGLAGGPAGRGAPAAADCPAAWIEVAHRTGASTRVRCGGPGGPPVRGPGRLLVGLPIDVLRASAATLEVLPRIGPERARAIVGARCTAPLRRLEDLQRIHGIGPRTVEGLRAWAVVGPGPPDCPRASSTLPP